MYSADLVPCAGSEKQTRNTFLGSVISSAVPEGVRMNILSFAASAPTAMVGAEVVAPTSICMPQSFRLL